jgi:flagellar operon protein
MTEKPFIMAKPIQPLGKTQSRTAKLPVKGTKDFEQILQQEMQEVNGLKFSRHAAERLEARKINLDQAQLGRLHEAVVKAEAKGAKESLILVDDLAFIVSVRNRTVVTAVDGDYRKGNIFTNIDSAVIN